MSQELEFHKKEYAESVRLYLWYLASPFSFFQGKASKTEAERYRCMANYHFDEIVKRSGKSKE